MQFNPETRNMLDNRGMQVNDSLIGNGVVAFPNLQSSDDSSLFKPLGIDANGYLAIMTNWFPGSGGGGGGDTISGTAGQMAYFIGTTNITSDGNNLYNPVNFVFEVGDLGNNINNTQFKVGTDTIILRIPFGSGSAIRLDAPHIYMPTLSASSFVFTDASKNLVSIATPLTTTNGGTGQSSWTQGDIPFYTSGTALSKLAKNTTATRYLSNQGTSNAPSWNQVNVANGITGTVPTTNGGTGTATTFTQGSVVFAGASGNYAQDNANFFWDATNHWLGIDIAIPLYPVHIKNVNNKGLTIDNAGSGSLQLFVGNGSGGFASGANYIVSNGTDLYFKTVSAIEQMHINAQGINIFDATAISAPVLTSGIRTDIHANGGTLSSNNALIQLHTDNAADALITWRTTGTNERAGIFLKHSTFDFHIASVFHDIIFDTGLAGDSERVRITFDGNVGIGTNSPQKKLHNNGTVRFQNLGTQVGDTSAYQILVRNTSTGDVLPFGYWPAAGGAGAPTYPGNEIPYGNGSTPGGITDPNFTRDPSAFITTIIEDNGAGDISSYLQGSSSIDLKSIDAGTNVTEINQTATVLSSSFTDGTTVAFSTLDVTASQLIFVNSSGKASGIAATEIDGLTLQNNGHIWIWPASDGVPGAPIVTDGGGHLSFSSASYALADLSNLASVAINTALLPGASGINIGSTAKPFQDLFLFNAGTSYGTNYIKLTGAPTGTRTLTLPDASGTILVNNVGISGGTTLIGGNGSGESLTLKSTSHATLGKILFGTSSYDEVNNRLGIGTTSPSLDISVVKSGGLSQFNMISYNSAGSDRCILFFQTAQGTLASPSNVSGSDNMGEFIGAGYAGGAFRNVAAMNFRVPASPGTISSSNLPSEIYWEVTPASSIVRAEMMRLSSAGSLYIGGAANATARLQLVAGSTAASSAPFKLTTGAVNNTAESGAVEYTTPQLFFTNGGAQRQEIPQIQQSRVSTQFDATSSTALSPITGLTATLVAGKKYRFEAILYTSSNVAGGVQADISGTCTATAIIYEGLTTNAGTTTQGRGTALSTSVGGITAVTAAYIRITGLITVNAAGTLTVRFAQNTSNVAASSVLVGSTFVTTEIN